MEIRQASIGDLETITTLNVHVQKVHAEAFPDLFEVPSSDTFSASIIAKRLAEPSNYFFIANVGGQDIGYVYARVIHWTENLYQHAMDYVHIDQISINPEY